MENGGFAENEGDEERRKKKKTTTVSGVRKWNANVRVFGKVLVAYNNSHALATNTGPRGEDKCGEKNIKSDGHICGNKNEPKNNE